ncbi:hypothetical protein [Candidatus Thiosymbion oneisti]|uniref:hypothetical protein n=1 Tax=Candidatus Thiosymbion oneisti TaxID=589554 RepID=UPI000B7CFA62|nr:hypothetical protein [Candidatus Thiosymbion oneisti]
MRFVFLLLALLAWPAFGSECFCLVAADDALWFDCREIQSRIFCLDKDTGKQEPIKHQDLTRVAGGEPPCTPCRRNDAVDLNGIRGEDDEQKTPPATTTQPAAEED